MASHSILGGEKLGERPVCPRVLCPRVLERDLSASNSSKTRIEPIASGCGREAKFQSRSRNADSTMKAGLLRSLARLIALICIANPLGAQTTRELILGDGATIPATHNQRGVAVRIPVKCSPNGDLYAQFVGDNEEPGVSIVSADRQRVVWFGLRQVPNFQTATLLDFAPGSSHDVFLLASKEGPGRAPPEYFIIHLKEGTVGTATKVNLKPGFKLRQLAMLGADDFVVSGFFGWQHQHLESFTGVFDGNGNFLKPLTFTGDLTGSNNSPNVTGKDPLPVLPADAGEFEVTATEWLEAASLQSADDGSVYMTRKTPQGPVFIIPPGGGEARRILLTPPKPEAVLSSAKVGGGRLVADYYVRESSGGLRDHYLSVTDLFSGKLLESVHYPANSSTGVGLVCYREHTFEFVGYSDGHLRVVGGQ